MANDFASEKNSPAAPAIAKLDSVSFDTFLGRGNPLVGGDSSFDLRGVRLITASALTQLAAALFALSRRGLTPTVLIDDSSVRSYLARAGFVDVLRDVATIQPPLVVSWGYDFRHGTSPMLIELTRVETGKELSSLLDRIVATLRSRLKYRKYDAFDVATAVSEVAQNSFDHNSGAFGLIAMQVYGKGSQRFLEIGVSDCGDGILTTLKRNPRHRMLSSDLEAIREASKLGVSEHEDQTRGTGLYHLLEMALEHGGSVQIRSGAGKVRYRMDKRQGWSFAVPSFPGVQVALTLPSKGRT